MNIEKIYIILHNVSSIQRVHDVARIVFSTENKFILVITKPTGAAAQIAIPEIFREAYKHNKPIIILPDLKDAIDLLKPDQIYTLSHEYGERINPENLELKPKTAFITAGTEPGLSKNEALTGKPIYIKGFNTWIGPAGETAIIIHTITNKIKNEN